VIAAPVLLEVCVETVGSAIAAERGGAHRIELCSNLAVEGLTPGSDLIKEVRRRVSIPLHVLIRPRAGDFQYTQAEFEAMKREIRRAKLLRANGVALGVLDADERVDVARTRELVVLSRPLSVTFHRAFDVCGDLRKALEDVVETGADRILTSGGARTAEEGSARLAEFVKSASGRIGVLACGSIRAGNVRGIVEATGVREVHASLRDRRAAGIAGDLRAAVVARLVEAAGARGFEF